MNSLSPYATVLPRIAIIGAGPAGCALAALLGARGLRPVLFDDGRRPEMVVGESLLPAVVPQLRRLGIEERVAAISRRKPGVSFIHDSAAPIHFDFAPIARLLPTYSYNVDRPVFDALLKTRVIELGTRVIPQRARVIPAPAGSARDLLLDEASLAAVPEWHGRQPDLLVDASGRTRLFSRILGLSADRGKRDDICHFAHFTNCRLPEPAGQTEVLRLRRGWGWKIPLPGKLSVGIVLNKEAARELGANAEERLENSLRQDPMFGEIASARRISSVATYTNYQLISRRSHGSGWVLAGDAFGFVDPMLSSGLFLGLQSAFELEAALFAGDSGSCLVNHPEPLANSLDRCGGSMRGWLTCFSELVDYFYDGTIHSLHQSGVHDSGKGRSRLQKTLERLVKTHVALLTSGARTRSATSHWCLKTASRWLTSKSSPPEHLAIR